MFRKVLNFFASQSSGDKSNCPGIQSSALTTVQESKTLTEGPEQKAIRELQQLVKGRGHQDYFCLHKSYSPNSVVPAIDFSSWIKKKFHEKDTKSLSVLLRKLGGSRGIDIGNKDYATSFEPDEVIDRIMNLNLTQFLKIDKEGAIDEIKTCIFLSCNHSGLSGFILSTSLPRTVAKVLFPWNVSLTDPTTLMSKANKFIRKMRKEAPYWKDVPLFKETDLQYATSISADEETFLNILRTLPFGSRLHLFDLCSWTDYGSKVVSRSLGDITSYETRQFGIDAQESSLLLLNSGMVQKFEDPKILVKKQTKNELIALLETCGAEFKRNMKKDDFANLVLSNPICSTKLLSESTFFVKVAGCFAGPCATTFKRIYTDAIVYGLILGFIFD